MIYCYKYKLLVLCTYSLKKCGLSEVIDVITNHEFALIGETLNKMRQNYVNDFIPVFNQIIQVLLSDIIIWCVLLELHIEDNDELKDIMNEFRTKFVNSYNDYDISTINKEYIMVWGPFWDRNTDVKIK